MLDCWKYSCQGATVVPMIEMMSSTALEEAPPRMPGMTAWCSTVVKWGLVTSTSGTMKKLMATKSIMNRSHRWNEPDAVTAKSRITAMGTEIYGETPK